MGRLTAWRRAFGQIPEIILLTVTVCEFVGSRVVNN